MEKSHKPSLGYIELGLAVWLWQRSHTSKACTIVPASTAALGHRGVLCMTKPTSFSECLCGKISFTSPKQTFGGTVCLSFVVGKQFLSFQELGLQRRLGAIERAKRSYPSPPDPGSLDPHRQVPPSSFPDDQSQALTKAN